MCGGIIRRALYTYQTEGLRGVWRKSRNRLAKQPQYRRLLVLELPFTDALPIIEPKVPATFEELAPADVDELIALRPYLTRWVIEQRLEAGHRFYVAKLNGRIVHTRLVAVNKAYIGYLKLAFPLSPREVYFGEAYTVPEFRRQGLHSACLSFVSRLMRQSGYHHAIALVYPRNRPALRSLEKVGFRRRGIIGFVSLLGAYRYFYWARQGGFDRLDNALFVPRGRLVPAELQGQIW